MNTSVLELLRLTNLDSLLLAYGLAVGTRIQFLDYIPFVGTCPDLGGIFAIASRSLGRNPFSTK